MQSGLKLAGLRVRPPRLETPWLNDTQITDEGVRQLAHVKSLRIVWLMRTRASDESVEELRRALPDAKIWN